MGFGFSAGLFDFLLNWNIGTQPWMLIPIGLGFAVVYYFLFRFVIRKWNLRTPGREEEDEDSLDEEDTWLDEEEEEPGDEDEEDEGDIDNDDDVAR